MRKHILETLVGLGITLFGFILGFLNLLDSNNVSLFSSITALALIFVGVAILFRAGRKDRHAVSFPPIGNRDHETSLLHKHNDLAHTYAKTSQMRDKLKVIKHSGNE